MSERTCGNCRFSTWVSERGGLQCQRNPPEYYAIQRRDHISHGFFFPTVDADDSCGEWKDDSTSPETEARQDLRQQLVVAMVAAGSNMESRALWEEASRIADCDPEVNNE
jgi:hypothetical protein